MKDSAPSATRYTGKLVAIGVRDPALEVAFPSPCLPHKMATLVGAFSITCWQVGKGQFLPQMQGPLLSFSHPLRGTGPKQLPLLFPFPSVLCPSWLHGDLSCSFRCLRSSASVQPVLCENCSICRCTVDAFVERDAFHILLLLRHLGFLCGCILNEE